jgi:hypothetical protein
MKLKGQRRGESGGNYVDMVTGESFWVSGVKGGTLAYLLRLGSLQVLCFGRKS